MRENCIYVEPVQTLNSVSITTSRASLDNTSEYTTLPSERFIGWRKDLKIKWWDLLIEAKWFNTMHLTHCHIWMLLKCNSYEAEKHTENDAPWLTGCDADNSGPVYQVCWADNVFYEHKAPTLWGCVSILSIMPGQVKWVLLSCNTGQTLTRPRCSLLD